jgi:hypothetical protein
MVVDASDTTHGDVLWVTATVPVIVVEVNVTGTVFVTSTLSDDPVDASAVVPANNEALTLPAITAPGVVPKFVGVPSAVPAHWLTLTFSSDAAANVTRRLPARSVESRT